MRLLIRNDTSHLLDFIIAPRFYKGDSGDEPVKKRTAAMSEIVLKIKKYAFSEGARYTAAGICTTLVSIGSYAILCRFMSVFVSNVISISTAIVFAYIVNKLFVFRSHCDSFPAVASECARFIGARLSTMAIEVGGVFLMYDIMHFNKMSSKLAAQVIVFISNYLISKFLVFSGVKNG